MTMVIILH